MHAGCQYDGGGYGLPERNPRATDRAAEAATLRAVSRARRYRQRPVAPARMTPLLLAAASLLVPPTAPPAAPDLPFHCVQGTGSSATVVLPKAPRIALPSGDIEAGDVVAVYTSRAGCVGTATWTGEALALTVWADDPLTSGLDGFEAADAVELRVLDVSDGTVYAGGQVDVDYEDGRDVGEGLVADHAYVVAGGPADDGDPDAAAVLHAPAPNPTAGHAAVRFEVRGADAVRLSVFDMLGREVAAVVDEPRSEGSYTESLPVQGLAPGMYMVRLLVGGQPFVRPLTVAR